MHTCPAALNIAGEHFPCDWMEQMAEGSTNHEGWAHSNKDAQAIWTADPAAIKAARAGAEAAGR
jgi:hypothetical protein